MPAREASTRVCRRCPQMSSDVRFSDRNEGEPFEAWFDGRRSLKAQVLGACRLLIVGTERRYPCCVRRIGGHLRQQGPKLMPAL